MSQALKKSAVALVAKLDYLSAVSMRLVQLTGKHPERIHPKHLVKTPIWYENYLKHTDSVLDLGCGIGANAIKITSKVKKVVGLDIDKESIRIAQSEAKLKRTKNIQFITGDANKKLPFKNNAFDKVLCFDVLEHLEKRNFALTEIKRILKPKGLLFLVTDNPRTSWKKLQKSVGLFYYADSDHKYEYPKEEITQLLKDKGFKVDKIMPVTYDTPIKGLIDLTGGFSLSLYKRLQNWRFDMVKKLPHETTGYRIIAQKNSQAHVNLNTNL